jgi:hypothetical protein
MLTIRRPRYDFRGAEYVQDFSELHKTPSLLTLLSSLLILHCISPRFKLDHYPLRAFLTTMLFTARQKYTQSVRQGCLS